MVERDPTDDAAVVREMAAGSEAALETLYDRYATAIFAAAYRLTSDRGTAEEVVQETFLALWNRAETFDPAAGSLAAWLHAIARNRAIDRLRAAGRRPSLVALVVGGGHGRGRDPGARAARRRAARSSPGRAAGRRPRQAFDSRRAAARRSGPPSRRCRRSSGRSSCWPIRRTCHRPRSPSGSAGRSGPSRHGRGGRSCACATALGAEFGPGAGLDVMPVPAGEDR